eukprot:COSAG01_NODE_10489_length_2152_cov_10.981978_2_plen_93_part_00
MCAGDDPDGGREDPFAATAAPPAPAKAKATVPRPALAPSSVRRRRPVAAGKATSARKPTNKTAQPASKKPAVDTKALQAFMSEMNQLGAFDE